MKAIRGLKKLYRHHHNYFEFLGFEPTFGSFCIKIYFTSSKGLKLIIFYFFKINNFNFFYLKLKIVKNMQFMNFKDSNPNPFKK